MKAVREIKTEVREDGGIRYWLFPAEGVSKEAWKKATEKFIMEKENGKR